MARILAIFMFFGCLLVTCDGFGGLNPLGSGIGFPLLPFDGSSLVNKMFDKEKGIFGKKCEGEKKSGFFSKLKKGGKIGFCTAKSVLKSKVGSKAKESCKASDEFMKCVSKEVEASYKKCDVPLTDKAFIKTQLHVFETMAKKLCANNAEIAGMTKKSSGCIASKRKQLAKCVAKNTKPSMKYDAVGCKAAWSFVGCVEDGLNECSSFGSTVEDVMSAGLKATPCKDYKPKSKASNMSPVVTQLILGTLLARFLL